MLSTISKPAARYSGELTRDNLKDYQLKSIDFIRANDKCALWVDMGLGKTVTSLVALSELLYNFEICKTLIIAPKRVCVSTWPSEFKKWAGAFKMPLTYQQLTGLTPASRQRCAKRLDGVDIHIINRENVTWLVDFWGNDWPYDAVIIDESSSFKSHSAKRFKSLKKVQHKINTMVELTGTPASNNLIDIWPQIFLLDGGERLGKTITKFRQTYFEQDYSGYNWLIRDGAKEKIYAKIQDICLTLSAQDYLDMPDRTDHFIKLDLPAATRAEYKELEREFLLEMGDDTVTVFNAASLSGKLLQYCNGAIYKESGSKEFIQVHDLKLDALEDIIEAANGEPVLIAYNFQSDLVRLKARFKNLVVLDDNPATIKKWNAKKIKILAAHPASAGHGLNLQDGGNIIVWFGLNWSLELYQQFNARLHRQGQEKPVAIYHLVIKDSVDETVIAALDRKNITQSELLTALKRDIRKGMK